MAENHSFWNSAFWQSWMGKIAAVYAAFRALPEDRVISTAGKTADLAGSALKTGGKAALHGGDIAQHHLRGAGRTVLFWSIVPQVIAFCLAVYGIVLGNKWFVYGGGCVSAVSFIAVYIIMKVSVGALLGATAAGTAALGGTAGDILGKVGFKTAGTSLKTAIAGMIIEFKKINDAMKALLVFTALPVGYFFVAHLPHWYIFLTFALGVALAAMSSGLISAKTGDETHDTWRLIRKIIFVIAVYDALMAFWMIGFSHTYNTFGPGHIYMWLENPEYREAHNFINAGWVGTIAIVGFVAGVLWIIAGRFSDEVSYRMSKGIKWAAIAIILFVFIFRGPFTSAAKKKYKKYVNKGGEVTQPVQAAKPTEDPKPKTKKGNFPNFGDSDLKPNTEKAPDVPIVPRKKKVRKKTPSKPTPKADPSLIKKRSTPKQGDGYDRATELLDEVGL